MTCPCLNCSRTKPEFTRRIFLLAAAMATTVPVALANLANGDLRLERLFSSFISPCCWRENLLVHASPTADELRADIRKQVNEGKSDDQIKSAFLARYSTRILAMPEGVKAKWLTWTPWVLSAAGMAGVVVVIARLRKPNTVIAKQDNLPDLPDSEW